MRSYHEILLDMYAQRLGILPGYNSSRPFRASRATRPTGSMALAHAVRALVLVYNYKLVFFSRAYVMRVRNRSNNYRWAGVYTRTRVRIT